MKACVVYKAQGVDMNAKTSPLTSETLISLGQREAGYYILRAAATNNGVWG